MSDKTMISKIILFYVCFNCVFGNPFVASDEPIVETTSGKVKGLTIKVLNQEVNRFWGIPYAIPPLGNLRFTKPKPITKPIEGIIDGTKQNYHICIQSPRKDVNTSEDCLVLNICSPKSENSTKLKPVMFWIYGGGLIYGSIFGTDGCVLASHGVVFAAVNYRLGPLGFLYSGTESAPGNMGFYDQNLGLKWVRENIHLFGGDKNQITIFGESAGSWSVSAQLLSPLSKGLFKRAILQSGAQMYNKDKPVRNKEEAILQGKQIAKHFNCTDDKQWLECLRKVDAKLLLPSVIGGLLPTQPTVGTEFLPVSAHQAFNELKFNKDLDIMAGVTKDEGSSFVQGLSNDPQHHFTKQDFEKAVQLTNNIFHNINVENITKFYLNNVNTSDSNAVKWKIFDFTGDIFMKCPTYLFAKRYAQHSSHEINVFFYELTHVLRPIDGKGIYHSADVAFVFGGALLNPKSTTKENVDFTKEVVRMWTDFVKNGKPDNNWPKLIDTKTQSSVTQIKELNPKTPHNYFKGLFDKSCDGIWKDYY